MSASTRASGPNRWSRQKAHGFSSPPYSSDLNPIEMAFSKLKALLRKRAARSCDAIAEALGGICNLFSVTECRNYFRAAGYEAD
ncbi:transposase [Sinorhizobium sp. BJ1]|uniref:transposase n=1 Tax=Sinorhizobium sp. BJ1 TaxID=2035455 RepID=UPI001FDED885|nr:transposase [Sinorhizobium sp. BJ1]